MKVIEDRDESALIECDCGERFVSDACTEENCHWDEAKRCNYPQCPKCKKVDG
jgi:hypothetical protein